MAKLVFSVIESLDGYVAEEAGRFDWAEPDESVHTFVNDLERPVGTYLYGRRKYDVMAVWEAWAGSSDEAGSRWRHLRGWTQPRRSGNRCRIGR